jgi:hypothetical protein
MALAACAETPVITRNYVIDYYTPQLLSYAAGKGGMYTEVTGNPFQGEKAALDRLVTKAFETAHFGPQLAFFTEKPVDHSSAYRTVVLFDAAPTANGARLCSDPDRPQTDSTAGEVRVMAALCSTDLRLTSAYGRVSGVQSPDDPRVERMLHQLGLSLFPPAPANRLRGGGDDDFMP